MKSKRRAVQHNKKPQIALTGTPRWPLSVSLRMLHLPSTIRHAVQPATDDAAVLCALFASGVLRVRPSRTILPPRPSAWLPVPAGLLAARPPAAGRQGNGDKATPQKAKNSTPKVAPVVQTDPPPLQKQPTGQSQFNQERMLAARARFAAERSAREQAVREAKEEEERKASEAQREALEVARKVWDQVEQKRQAEASRLGKLHELFTSFLMESRKGDAAATAYLKKLLKRGVQLTTVHDTRNNSLLHQAAARGCAQAAQLLLQHGLDVTAMNNQAKTPLAIAEDFRKYGAHYKAVYAVLVQAEKPERPPGTTDATANGTSCRPRRAVGAQEEADESGLLQHPGAKAQFAAMILKQAKLEGKLQKPERPGSAPVAVTVVDLEVVKALQDPTSFWKTQRAPAAKEVVSKKRQREAGPADPKQSKPSWKIEGHEWIGRRVVRRFGTAEFTGKVVVCSDSLLAIHCAGSYWQCTILLNASL